MSGNSKQEIMDATYKALCVHGYADISIQKIADEFDKGKSLIYYHYDDKEDLMLTFLDFVYDDIEASYTSTEGMTPEERMDDFLKYTLGLRDESQWDFLKAYLELRAYAAHNEAFAEKFKEIDEMALQNITEIIEGMGANKPEKHGKILLNLIEGAASKKVSIGDKEGLHEFKELIEGELQLLVNEDLK